ncbi:MAG: YifB family Mg chelatase-like AAA ATPase, partial [Deltaproteobacteria bacterium]|nr:YifB family Mg chelatase-like AAA ATPase [Deltaproteobacteria bacterium]
MLAKIISSSLIGIDAKVVEVEVDVSRGMPVYSTVGLPDNAVKESKERVKSAIKNSGYAYPVSRITVNLAPADIKKEGTTFDLPVAVGMLATQGVIKSDELSDYIMVGELSLDGRIRPVKGALSIAVMAREMKKTLILPMDNAKEASIVEDVKAIGVSTLSELVSYLNGDIELQEASCEAELLFSGAEYEHVDISDVRGQEHVKRALEVAAAGGHNMLMVGPPGSGKTMLARRVPTVLPSLTLDEAIETTKIHSVAGLLDGKTNLIKERPFRAPHHTISDAGLVGGGQNPKPGEISLSHNGVLFLDEAPEFKKNLLEMLRQPLEDGVITISRAAVSVTYPSRFMLVCAMNPCPCGHLGDPKKDCTCTPVMIERYRGRISGPLLDRIDIHMDVPAVNYRELSGERRGDSSKDIKDRVEQ